MSKTHDKVLVIVEEVVQHVYLMDPDAQATQEAFQALPRLLAGEILEGLPGPWDKPPATLGKRAIKKGASMPALLQKHDKDSTYSRFTAVTFVIPDETGAPSLEIKATPTTFTRKPVTS